MCHFLISRNYGTIINPFKLPLNQLFTHYKFQQKIVRNEMAGELTLLLASTKLNIAAKSKKEDGKVLIKEIEDLRNSLLREDLI